VVHSVGPCGEVTTTTPARLRDGLRVVVEVNPTAMGTARFSLAR
jgi:hypothetical protein